MSTGAAMDMGEAVAVLRKAAADDIAVLTMSPIAFWAEGTDRHFRLLGTMGAAGSIGLGLALGAPDRRVWVIDGDGSLLMQLPVIAAVADAAPDNLIHVVIDNGIYAVSGAQPTPAPGDWTALLRAAGYADAVTCTAPDELRRALEHSAPGPRAIVVRCAPVRPDYPPGFLTFSAREEAARLRAALTGG